MNGRLGRTVLAIALGAIPGALGRTWITEWLRASFGPSAAPLGTLWVNGTGCLILAWFYAFHRDGSREPAPVQRLAIATGFCGAYTTFSTYGLETLEFLRQGHPTVAAIYGIGSLILGSMAVYGGVTLGRLHGKTKVPRP